MTTTSDNDITPCADCVVVEKEAWKRFGSSVRGSAELRCERHRARADTQLQGETLGHCPWCNESPQPDIPSHVGMFVLRHKSGCWLGRRIKPNGNWQEIHISEAQQWNTRAAVAGPYLCSCGGALTAEEYIVHYFGMGHDRGDPAFAATSSESAQSQNNPYEVVVYREEAAKMAFDAIRSALQDDWAEHYSVLQIAGMVAANIRRISPAAPAEREQEK